jgi:SPP1 family predicted phage head-tail adaptor
MRAGKLRHRVEIMADTVTLAAGNNEPTYSAPSAAATVWASVEPTAGNERLTAARTNADTTHRVELRYWSGLTAKHWFRFDGTRRLEILSIINPEERNINLVCECREVV